MIVSNNLYVPPIFKLLNKYYSIIWQGIIGRDNCGTAVQMHFVHGNMDIAKSALPLNENFTTPPLDIPNVIPLEECSGLVSKIKNTNDYSLLLALSCGRDVDDIMTNSYVLADHIIRFYINHNLCGLIRIKYKQDFQERIYSIYIFPSCYFINEIFFNFAPQLHFHVSTLPHLKILIFEDD